MDDRNLTTLQRVALALLYAEAERREAPRAFTIRHVGGALWARHTAAPGGSEYLLPDDALERLAAGGLIVPVGGDRFLLGDDWPDWTAVRPAVLAGGPRRAGTSEAIGLPRRSVFGRPEPLPHRRLAHAVSQRT